MQLHFNTISDTDKLYVSSRKSTELLVVDQQSLKLLDEIKLPAGEDHHKDIVDSE